MPDISQMKSSKFLCSGDCIERPLLLNMLNVTQENVAKEGDEPELKWCLHFSNHEKPLILNQINMQLIAQVAKSTRTEDWTGKQIVLYHDPSVQMAGRLVGGLRVRAPKNRPAAASAPAPAPAPALKPAPPVANQDVSTDPTDDDVPF